MNRKTSSRKWSGAIGLPGLAAFLFCGALGTPLLAQCSSDSISAAGLSCISLDQLDAIRLEQSALDSEERIRDALDLAGEMARCLMEKEKGQIDYGQRRQFLCLQMELLKFYAKFADSMMVAEDRFARASIAFNQCTFPNTGPQIHEYPRDCDSLVSQALLDYHSVFRAARQVQQDKAGSYSSYFQANQLGLDVLDPAPDYKYLQDFIRLSAQTAKRRPRYGRQVGGILGTALCDAVHLYPQHSEEISRAYILLVAFDGGNASQGAFAYGFVEKLEEHFGLAPAQWTPRDAPLCNPIPGPLPFPSLEVAGGSRIPAAAQVQDILNDLEVPLREMMATEEKVPNAWILFDRYASFLSSLSRSLKVRSIRDPDARQLRDQLMQRARDTLVDGIRFSLPAATSEDRNQIRRTFVNVVAGYADQLFKEARFQDLADYANGYFRKAQEIADEYQVQVLTGREEKELNRLLARAYTLLCRNTLAARHAHAAGMDVLELWKERDDLRREYGIGFCRREKPRN